MKKIKEAETLKNPYRDKEIIKHYKKVCARYMKQRIMSPEDWQQYYYAESRIEEEYKKPLKPINKNG